jgi:hypothetical protein
MADAPKLVGSDRLKDAYPKINQAVDNANKARVDSESALTNAVQANATSESVQTQLNTIIIDSGTSDAETLQARTDVDGFVYTTVKERIDAEQTKLKNLQSSTLADYKKTQFERSVFPYGVNKSLANNAHRHFGKILKLSGNNLISIYRKATGHLTNDGSVACMKSSDGGVTWGTEETLYDHPSLDCRVGAVGMTKTGRLIVAFGIQDNSTVITSSLGYIYSDDEGKTWSSYIEIEAINNTSIQYAIAYGSVIQIGNRIGFTYYQKNKPDNTISLIFRISLNNGDTWTTKKTVISGATDYNEMDIIPIGNNTILGVCRVGSGTIFKQFLSTDLGDTWINQGDTNTENAILVSPSLTEVILNNEKYILFHYVNRTSLLLVRRIVKADDAINSATKWRSPGGSLYSAPNASGYQSALQDDEGKIIVLYFRESSTASIANTDVLLLTDYVGQNIPQHESDWFSVAINTTYNIPLIVYQGIPNAKIPPKQIMVTFKTDATAVQEWIVQQIHTDGSDGHGCSISFDTSNIYIRTGVTNVLKAGGTSGGINATTGLYKVRVWY